MLVLSRKRHESVVIGGENPITITVVRIDGEKVRLGITAPLDVAVDRAEVAAAKAEVARQQGVTPTDGGAAC